MIRRAVPTVVCIVVAMLATAPLSGTAHGTVVRHERSDDPEGTVPYVVVLDDGVRSPRATAHRHARELGIDVRAVYARAVHSYLADLTPSDAGRLRGLDEVAAVDRDRTLPISQTGQITPHGVARVGAPANAVADVDGQDDTSVDVDVAVLDSGVSPHPDLNVASQVDCSRGHCTSGGGDVHGHGTHIAGTIAAIDDGVGVVGVAPGARIHSVRVCGEDGSCSLSALLAGIAYVASWSNVIEVANISLGAVGAPEGAIDAAISQAVAQGVVFTVAAGNEAVDAAHVSPANHPEVIAVSAMADTDGAAGGAGGPADCLPRPNQDDTRLFFSNYGRAVDITAPGACIMSTRPDGGYTSASGTSMAAPHVAGAAALLASGSGDPTDRTSALAIAQRLVQSGSTAWVDDSGDGIQEPLLDVSSLTSSGGSTSSSPAAYPSAAPAQPAPTAAPTTPTSGSTVAASQEVLAAATQWIYDHTPQSVDWEESSCIAWVMANIAGPDLVAQAGGDLTQVYPYTSPGQDAAISAVLPRCLDPQTLQELRATGFPW